MSDPLVVPYSELGFGGARPYLFLQVTGLDGRGRTIPGLIDSGADNSVLPAGYAPIMGYSGATVPGAIHARYGFCISHDPFYLVRAP